MSKALRNYPESQRDAVANRRAQGKGNGASAALDYLSKKGKTAEQIVAAGISEIRGSLGKKRRGRNEQLG